MKLFLFLIIFILTTNCSFDNKSGIWQTENDNINTKDDLFSEFKTLSSEKNSFNKVIKINKNFKFNIENPQKNYSWSDIFFDQSNNFLNYKYNEENRIIFKSKKLTNYSTSKYILYKNNKVILSDKKGNIIIFSIKENKIINKFNFYKKNFKKINKEINFVIDNNIIYISDNIGFVYSYDLTTNSVLWAKNYKIPFRSNIKVLNSYLITSNQNNDLYFLDKKTGDTIKLIPTEETTVKNQFINNLSLNNNTSFFLNTYGSLYAIDIKNLKIKWFFNLNQSIDINPSNLFLSNEIVVHKNNLVISSNRQTYIFDINTGLIKYKKNFSSIIKPIISGSYLFSVTKNNLLIASNLEDGKIVYSNDINQEIANYLGTNKNKVKFKNIFLINNKIFIFLNNSYVLKFKIDGNLKEVVKLPCKILSNPIFIDSSILFLDKKNKLCIID
jgi:outer membrane protein assembly factor BamB